jgi:hypothetical protein
MHNEALAALDALMQGAKPEELPALVVALAARLATLGAKLSRERLASIGAAEPELWITPDRAAEIAAVSRRRVYQWARGKRWASRPSRKTLRISERGFRAWIAAR